MSVDECQLLTGADLHRKVIEDGVMEAERFVWIATANLKDMHVEMAKGYRPILEVFDRMAKKGVRFRIVHSDLPSRPFRDTLEQFPLLTSGGLELQICPRSHWKMVIVDGRLGYFGSANFTGAGLGVKSDRRRNLEIGALTEDPEWVGHLMTLFDEFWMGAHCADCAFADRCPDPIRSG